MLSTRRWDSIWILASYKPAEAAWVPSLNCQSGIAQWLNEVPMGGIPCRAAEVSWVLRRNRQGKLMRTGFENYFDDRGFSINWHNKKDFFIKKLKRPFSCVEN